MSKAVWTYLPKITWMKNKPTKRCFMFQVTNKMKLKAIMKYLSPSCNEEKKKKSKPDNIKCWSGWGATWTLKHWGTWNGTTMQNADFPKLTAYLLMTQNLHSSTHTHTNIQSHVLKCFIRQKKTEKKQTGYLWTNKLRYICTMQYFSNEKEQSGSVSNRLC